MELLWPWHDYDLSPLGYSILSHQKNRTLRIIFFHFSLIILFERWRRSNLQRPLHNKRHSYHEWQLRVYPQTLFHLLIVTILCHILVDQTLHLPIAIIPLLLQMILHLVGRRIISHLSSCPPFLLFSIIFLERKLSIYGSKSVSLKSHQCHQIVIHLLNLYS